MSQTRIWIAGAILAGFTVAADAASTKRNEDTPLLHDQLSRIANRRIFFAHQSVGDNVLDGIRLLAGTANIPIHIVNTPLAKDVSAATLGHVHIEKNGDPYLKLQNFERSWESKPEALDIALIKFCFVDFNAETDTKLLFSRYQATIDTLKSRNPQTVFVHVTAPLTSISSWPKEWLRRLAGRGNATINARREEYNSLLRTTYVGREPIFDLARVESTLPDGTSVSVEWQGKTVAMLAPDYTDDGGHLNQQGSLRVARELVSVLSAIPSRKTLQAKYQ